MERNGSEMIRPEDAPDVIDTGKNEARGDFERADVEEHRCEQDGHRASGFSLFRSGNR